MLNHHSHAMKVIGSISWLVTALAAIATGLMGLGVALGKNFNIWDMDFIVNKLPWLVLPAHYIIGICGLLSLISWFTCLGECTDGRHHNHNHHDNKR